MNRDRLSGQATDGQVLLIVLCFALSFVAFGLTVSGPVDVARGVVDILMARDVLVTDYVGIGGLGAAFVNAGLLIVLVCGVYRVSKAKIDGAAVACLLLMLGIGLFGNNLLNVWPGVAGTYLYAKHQRQPFAEHINTAFFGAALAPVFSEILFTTSLPLPARLALSLGTKLCIGFVVAPIAKQLFRAHDGFTLYNMGFVAGLVGTVVVAVYKAYGYVPEPVLIWTSGYNLILGVFLGALFASTAMLGLLVDRQAWRKLGALHRLPGQAPTDFITKVGLGPTLLNMAITGGISTGYVLAIGGDLNGPIVGTIFSVVGFAAFGKHTFNIVPVMAGVFLASLTAPWHVTDPSILFAALFGTALAPIPGRFGPHWGVVAGFLHSCVVLTVGSLTAGLNLYNNGFAAGIVASLLVPVIVAWRRRTTRTRNSERS
ncbi:DUF1576 domain-containing protein [Amycolatopsis sp. NPDC051372]|uniref:DUF1576 domain-containing protein n=1 Tax=Amycolatopsis sp. NPDC051372 TaxID=3155669 RepID=UPI0034251322